MAFINKEQVAKKRAEIKKLYPSSKGWKFSIRCINHSTIDITIFEAPFQMLEDDYLKKGHEPINHFWINDKYKAEKKEVLSNLYKIANKDNFDNSDSMIDYHHVGFYVSLSVGSWEKPFSIKLIKPKKVKTFDEFYEVYKPKETPNEDLLQYETYGEDLEEVKKANPKKVWTVLDSDGKDLILTNGVWYINRLFYLICDVECLEERGKINIIY